MQKTLGASKLTIPNDLAYGTVVGAYVKAVANKIGFNEEELMMIELGVDEAFTNIVEHAFVAGEEATFDVLCEPVPLGIGIALREQGMPFDPTKLPEYDPELSLDQQTGKGLGLYLMKQAMDEVAFHNLGKAGKETLLVKYLSSKDIQDYFSEDELERYEEIPDVEEQVKPRDKIEFDIRGIRPSEAIEVSKCIYKTYGYSYDKEHAYFPERIVELNDNGLMISAVAATDEGDVGGHCALFRDSSEETIAELGMAVVNPDFRGQGCISLLSDHLMEQAHKTGLTGLFAKAVTNHPFSQKAMHKLDFSDCGLLLANVPTTRTFKGIAEGLSQRDSLVICFKNLQTPGTVGIYAPPHHAKMIERLYQNLGQKVELKVPPELQLPDTESIFKTKVASLISVGYIHVQQYGADILQAIQAKLKQLCLEQTEIINLYVGLDDPMTYHLVSEFEKLGFFFTGLFPGAKGDSLMLQYLNNVPFDYANIVQVSDIVKELCAYVKARDPNQ